jgi:hypothetical protein
LKDPETHLTFLSVERSIDLAEHLTGEEIDMEDSHQGRNLAEKGMKSIKHSSNSKIHDNFIAGLCLDGCRIGLVSFGKASFRFP